MNASTGLWRLSWKEYRAQRSLWISVLTLTIFSQILIAVVASLTNSDPISGGGYVAMAFVAVSVYMLGCGAMLFAMEHELGTYDFQRTLPVTTWQVYAAKLGVGVAGGLLLMLALLIFEHAVFVGWRNVLSSEDWVAGGITFAEIFLWATLFSLLLRHPLRAAVAGIIAMSVTVCVVLPMISQRPWEEDILLYHRSSLGPRSFVVFLLFVLDTWLIQRWFEGRIGIPRFWIRRRREGSEYALVPEQPLPLYRPGRQLGWSRLVHVTWRQGRWILLPLCGLFFLAVARVLFDASATPSLVFPTAILMWSAMIMGLCTFTLDQWAYQFRFFAERGIPPRWLWLSRQAVWFLPVFGQLVCVQWLAWRFSSRNSPQDIFMSEFGYLLSGLLIFALAQLSAMLIRSTLVAFVVTNFASILAWIWTILMVGVGIPLWWSVVPIPILAFFITWRFSTDWLEERHGREHRWRLAATMGLPLIAIAIACAAYRVYEIPLVHPGFAVSDYTRPQAASETETLGLYRRAATLMWEGNKGYMAAAPNVQGNLTEQEALWLKNQMPALPLLEKAHQQPTMILEPAKVGFELSPLNFLDLIRLHCENLTNAGRLNEAWYYYEVGMELNSRMRPAAQGTDPYLLSNKEKALLESIIRWSTHGNQSDDRLRVALNRLKAYDERESGGAGRIQWRHVVWTRFFQGEAVRPATLGLTEPLATNLQRTYRFMPWEAARAQRLLNLTTLEQLDKTAVDRTLLAADKQSLFDWHRTSIFPYDLIVKMDHLETELIIWRRATRQCVMIHDWLRQHGELPKSLSDLAGADYPDLPLDPVTQKPFAYFRDGIPQSVKYFSPEERVLSPNTPFLWSPGSSAMRLHWVDGKPRILVNGQEVSIGENLTAGIIWPLLTDLPTEKSDPD